ncbi:15175_t:CDS:2 [Acaulospora morrowiae]|uniref:15175_t:CDS:1 n=1 Tax=Acaulospora morrowiae TaxID=94023 RepID=A0A9N9C8S5_9GLOM|nr:15175_t:CDS:2 [Acaulospora morrowiae]
MLDKTDIRVVVAVDFGTTYSGFAYSNNSNPEIITNNEWPGKIGQYKTNTVLQYNGSGKHVEAWGYPALAKPPSASINKDSKPVELFKLHLGDIPEEEKPPLPEGLTYKEAISDYLHELVPAEYNDQAKRIMRECAFTAKLIDKKNSSNLRIITEPEAAAIYCMKYFKNEVANIIRKKFLICDIGGGTVDLTVRKLIGGDRLSELTECTGDYCGGSYVDQEFIKYVGRKVGETAISKFKASHYGQLQNLVQEFCRNVKLTFTGVLNDYKNIEIDLEEICPALKQYVEGIKRTQMEKDEWIIELDFESVKSMFDPIIGKIIRLIRAQLNESGSLPAMFLVGGFSESKYLQSRLKEEFSKAFRHISVPPQPITAVLRGAVEYGLNIQIVKNRVLKYTYGVKSSYNARVFNSFCRMATRGTKVGIDQTYTHTFTPTNPNDIRIKFDIYYTKEYDGEYTTDEGMNLLGTFTIDCPDPHLGLKRPIDFSLCFGEAEIVATAVNRTNGTSYDCALELYFT